MGASIWWVVLLLIDRAFCRRAQVNRLLGQDLVIGISPLPQAPFPPRRYALLPQPRQRADAGYPGLCDRPQLSRE